MLAQGLDAFDAAVLGTYAHGLAGDLARDQNGEVGLIAGDVVDALPDAFDHVVQTHDRSGSELTD
jgi:NAD(P)H-hydrate epimerase